MNVLIAGSTGMIGNLILTNCLQVNEINEITTLLRKPSSGKKNNKINEILVPDFEDYSKLAPVFQHIDIAFFCIGVYTGQVADDQFKKITVDYAVSFAKELKKGSPDATLCFLSGAGADRTEKSRTSFARYKGIAENRIAKMDLEFYSFRPGYIYPVTPRKEPNIMYRLSRMMYPMIKLFGKNASIKSTELANAMFNVGLNGTDKEVLENKDILNQL